MSSRQSQSPKAIIAAAVLGLVVGCNSNTPPPTSAPPRAPTTSVLASPPETTPTPVAPPPVGVRQEARDGAFAFIVTSVFTENEAPSKAAQGIFIVIRMTSRLLAQPRSDILPTTRHLSITRVACFPPTSMLRRKRGAFPHSGWTSTPAMKRSMLS